MAKILIVDDSEMFRDELREALVDGGHTVVEGVDGLDGLNKAKENADVDLLISDFNMPEMNGIEMVTSIKDLDSYKDTPVFILTTETSPELKQHASQVGVKAWIIKPFMAEKLLLVVDKILSIK